MPITPAQVCEDAAVKSLFRFPQGVTDRPRPLFVGSDIYRNAAFGRNHPLNIVRHATVVDLVTMLGWLTDDNFRESKPANFDQLAEFHDRAYLRVLAHANAQGLVEPQIRERYQIGTLENPLFEGLFERAAMTVGGSILAAELAAAGHVVFHPTGGTHHGQPDRAAGFCYLNDPVFAVQTLLKQGRERVMYVDLDAHHGDGVESAFHAEPRVTTVSIHEQDRWPFSGSRSHPEAGAFNFSVPAQLNDSEFNALLYEAVLPLAEAQNVDALVVCCGADCLAGDPLSSMQLSNVALWEAILELIGMNRPTIVLGGGGYNPWTVTRYWAGLWGCICGAAIPDSLPPAAQALMRRMECDLIDDEDVAQQWLTTLADKPAPGPVRDEIRSMVRNTLDRL